MYDMGKEDYLRPSEQGDIKELEKIQKTATKLVINFKKIPYKDRLINLKLPTFKYRRLRGYDRGI